VTYTAAGMFTFVNRDGAAPAVRGDGTLSIPFRTRASATRACAVPTLMDNVQAPVTPPMSLWRHTGGLSYVKATRSAVL